MNAVHIKVILDEMYTKGALLNNKWCLKDTNDKIFYKIKENYTLNYIVKHSYSELTCSKTNNKQIVKYEELEEFDLEDAWKNIWHNNYVPNSVEILFKDNKKDILLNSGWHIFVGNALVYDKNKTYLPQAPEGAKLSKVIYDNPGNTNLFIENLKKIIPD